MIARIRPETRFSHLLQSLLPAPRARAELEAELKAYFGVADVLLTQGGRVGLYDLLKVLPQQKVYLPAYTCWAVPDAVRHAGKQAVFVDIRPEDYNLDPARLAEVLTPGSIVLATHQFGIPCDIDAIEALARERECLVLEDNAAGFGALWRGRKTGTFGAASIVSFEFSKTLTCGRGGAVLFNDRALAARVRELHLRETAGSDLFKSLGHLGFLGVYLLITLRPLYPLTHLLFDRTRGMTTGYPPQDSSVISADYFADFDDRRARLVRLGLREIERIVARKREIAAFYAAELTGCEKIRLPVYPEDRQPVFMRYPVRVVGMSKEQFYRACVRRGLDLALTFSYSCAPDGGFPESERAAATVVNLPVYSRLTRSDLAKIKDVILSI